MQKLHLIFNHCKKPRVILILILSIFFLKGVFLATLYPLFTGQDEARHYNTIQSISYPAVPSDQKIKRQAKHKDKQIENYNFSQEIIHAGKVSDLNIIRKGLYDTANFVPGYIGKNENSLNSSQWKPLNYYYPADTATHTFYHTLASWIEKAFSGSNILVRFYLIRILSVFLGTLAVFLTYFIAVNIGLKKNYSLILTAMLAFQPKFTMYFTNINYDVLLIPLFFLFTLGGIFSLKNGLKWKNFTLMLLALILALITKGTAIVLLVAFLGLMTFHFYQKIKNSSHKLSYLSFLLVFFFLTIFLANTQYNLRGLLPVKNTSTQTFSSLQKYLDTSLTMGRFALSSRTYWGSLSWKDNWLTHNFTDLVFFIEGLAGIGLLMFFWSKKTLNFLPTKKYILFLLLMIVALQLGIRTYDWKVFMSSHKLVLGTPGRYFLPNLASHLILVFVGLGALLKKERYFKNVLLTGFILMFSFGFYIIFNLILPRFYL